MADKKENKKNQESVENIDKNNNDKANQESVEILDSAVENNSVETVQNSAVNQENVQKDGDLAALEQNITMAEDTAVENNVDIIVENVQADTNQNQQDVPLTQDAIIIAENIAEQINDGAVLVDVDAQGYPDGQEFVEMQGDEQEDFQPQVAVNSNKKKKVKVIKRLNIEKNQKAIARQHRLKMIGRVLACVFVLIFIGSIVGISAFSYSTADKLWWEYVGEEAGVEFKELFTLFNGIVDNNEDKIVTKGYTANDLKDFYTNLKRKMYLAQDYDISIEQIISSVMSATGDEQKDANSLSYTTVGVDGYDLQYVYEDGEGNIVTSDVKPMANQISDSQNKDDSLTGNEELDQLLKEIKFDFSSLEQYEGEANILEISDKQLGAVVNDAFSALSGSFEQLKELETTIGKSISEVLTVKQVIISGEEIDALSTNLKITVEVNAKELLSNILKEHGIPPIVSKILPTKLYASVKVYPYDFSKPIEASVNRMEETKVNKIVRIIDVILKKTGNTTSISDLLVQVNSKVVEVFEQAQQKLPIALVPTGSVNLYPIESLMGMLEVNVSEQAFLYMLKDIKLPTGESLGINMPSLESVKEQTNKFVSELSEKYCLDNSDGKISNDNTIKDVMDFASSEKALEAIHLNKMNFTESYSQQLKVRTSYEALAGMLSDYVKNEGLLEDISADIVKMSYASEILSVDIRVNLSQMLGYDDDSVMSSLIKQLVPEYIYVTANICVNTNKDVATTIEINKTGVTNSKAHLATLTALADKFGMDTSTLTYDEICKKIDNGLQDGLAQMQEKIGCEILFTPECAYLPNLFEVVCGTGLLDENEERKIQPQTLFSIMKQAYTYDVDSADKNKSSNAGGFIGELEGKYYLQKGKIVDNGDGSLLDSVMALKENFGSSIDKSALASDNRSLNQIEPKMTAGEFAYLMELNMDMENLSDTIKSAEMLGAKINDDEIIMYLKAQLYDTQSAVETKDENDLSKYSNLLPQFAYITLKIDTLKMTTGSQDNSVKVIINGMEDNDMSDFFSIIRKLTGDDVTEGQIENKIDAQVKDYMGNVKGIEYKFANGIMSLDNIFNVIANSDMVKADDPSEHVFLPEEIRTLLKELYGYDYQQQDFKPSTNLDNFIDNELYNKYFISDSFRDRLKEFERNDSLLDGFATNIGGDNFSADNIRVKDIVRDNKTIYGLTSLNNITVTKDKTQSQIQAEITENFKPKFTSQDLAYLLRTHVSEAGNMSFIKEQEVVYANNDENFMTLTLRGKDNLDDPNAKGLMPEYLYVNVTIELGSILSDGTREAMKVHALDINSISYVKNNGDNQDLPLLLTLVDRIQRNTQDNSDEPAEEVSLENIIQKIDAKLDNFKGEIHNKVFTVTFLANGGLIFNETVYQIALNSIFDASADNSLTPSELPPNEIDFRNGLCKVNNMPDTYEYSQGVYLDLKNGNRADNSNNAIAEINDKYALAKPLEDKPTAILSILGEYAKDYATSIDGKKLTSEQKRAMSVEQLRPQINGEELLLMLEKSVSFTSDGYQNAVLNALYIRNDAMIIVYKSPIEIGATNETYKALLPSEMSIIVSIDVNAIDNPNKICTQIGVNDLNEDEMNAIQTLMLKMNQKEGSESDNLEDVNKECSDNVRSTMKALTDNMKVRYVADETHNKVTGGGVMVLDSIYEVASQKINMLDPDGETLKAIDVKQTLEALFDGLDIDAYTPPSGKNPDEMKVSYTMDPTLEQSSNLYLNIATRKISGAIGGWNIASMIKTENLLEPLGFDATASNSADILKLKHTALIPKKANGDGTFDKIRATLGSLLDKEYFLITLDMDMDAAAGTKMSILPERMDLTLYMDLTSEDVSIIYNSMSDRQRTILSRLVKTSRPEGVGGLDLSNTDAVKSEIMNMKIIDEPLFSITLGQLLKSGGLVVPISRVGEFVTRNADVVLGMGAMIIEYQA